MRLSLVGELHALVAAAMDSSYEILGGRMRRARKHAAMIQRGLIRGRGDGQGVGGGVMTAAAVGLLAAGGPGPRDYFRVIPPPRRA